MPPRAEIPESLRNGPFTTAEALGAGCTSDMLAGRRFRRLFQGAYLPADHPVTLKTRCAAARLVLPESAAFCGRTAAQLYGLPLPDRSPDLHVAVPTGLVPRITGIVGHESVTPEEVGHVGGLPVSSPTRTFLDLAALLPLVDLVAAGDVLTASWVSLEELTNYVRRAYRRRGVRRAREAVTLIDPGARSAPETRARLHLVFAGLPRPVCNRDILDPAGGWLLRPDLAYPDYRVGIEYDGSIHRTDARKWRNDRYRRELVADLGWAILEITADDVFLRPAAFVARVHRRLCQQAARLGLADPVLVPYRPQPVEPVRPPR